VLYIFIDINKKANVNDYGARKEVLFRTFAPRTSV